VGGVPGFFPISGREKKEKRKVEGSVLTRGRPFFFPLRLVGARWKIDFCIIFYKLLVHPIEGRGILLRRRSKKKSGKGGMVSLGTSSFRTSRGSSLKDRIKRGEEEDEATTSSPAISSEILISLTRKKEGGGRS